MFNPYSIHPNAGNLELVSLHGSIYVCRRCKTHIAHEDHKCFKHEGDFPKDKGIPEVVYANDFLHAVNIIRPAAENIPTMIYMTGLGVEEEEYLYNIHCIKCRRALGIIFMQRSDEFVDPKVIIRLMGLRVLPTWRDSDDDDEEVKEEKEEVKVQEKKD